VLRATRIALAAAIVVGAVPAARGQAFDCVLLNDDNTNILVPPDECFTNPDLLDWCNCVRSLFTHPVKSEVSGFNQAVEWVMGNPGIANHRVEVEVGTLDLSGVEVGDVIGGSVVDELIPESVGFPPSTFFNVVSESVVTAVGENSVDFDVNVIQTSLAARMVLEYDPTDAEHSDGNYYKGRLTSNGPENGFVVEYRYATENISEDPASQPGIEIGDATTPGFTARFIFSFFTTESGVYTLPGDDTVDVATTLRKFDEDDLAEVLELGEDLCQEVDHPDPCKLVDELLQSKNELGENSPPTAVITALDGETLTLLTEPRFAQTRCGRTRVLFRGGNSDDGDGGIQGLTYLWTLVDGPEGGAEIPEATREFRDTEVTFSLTGTYEIELAVDDGGAEDHTDIASVVITVSDDFDINIPPTAVLRSIPAVPIVEIAGGSASITLDASESSNGFVGEDDCGQELTFAWTLMDGPPDAATIVSPTTAVTEVIFRQPDRYIVELVIDDGSDVDNFDVVSIEIEVTGSPSAAFRRGDADVNGVLELTDAVRTLNFLFLGGAGLDCPDAADTDDNGAVDLSDAIRVLNFLFLGGQPPEPPGSESCGIDPVDDELGACSYPSC